MLEAVVGGGLGGLGGPITMASRRCLRNVRMSRASLWDRRLDRRGVEAGVGIGASVRVGASGLA
jgi:hypothetical protein